MQTPPAAPALRTSPKRTSRDLRSASRFAILRALYALGTPSRQELAQQAGLSFATVATIVNELFAIGMLIEAGREDSGGGRPRARLQIDHRRGLLVGVDIAETYIHVDVFDAALSPLHRAEQRIQESADPDYLITQIVDAVRGALRAYPGAAVLGTGVSLPGPVQPEAGVSVFAPGWGWQQVPVQHLLSERLGLPVLVDNPLKATTVAELWFGHGRECADLVTVNLGTGVGAGIAIDGQLVRGVTNTAGEWGHTTLVLDGRQCHCGRLGCVEAYVGVPGVMETLRAAYPAHPILRSGSQAEFVTEFAAALEAGDQGARWLLAEVARHLGSAVANLVNILNPQRVVLTSWAATALAPWLLPPLRERLRTEVLPGTSGSVELVTTAIGDNPVVLGMATLALERFLVTAGVPSGATTPSP